MILPTKHTTIEQSLIGFGAYLLVIMDGNNTIDLLWQKYQTDFRNQIYPVKQTFDNLILTLVFLYSIGAIDEAQGEFTKCS
ncbi:MAG: hypothetical protein LBE13_01445 [Bacteroidales bacterium]|jgi:hypothetical protein|nr:hypothetical protein [Bacteroidales bacterium]